MRIAAALRKKFLAFSASSAFRQPRSQSAYASLDVTSLACTYIIERLLFSGACRIFYSFFQALRESGKDEDDFLTKTTLTMHFFGSRGTGTITFKQFMKYVIDLEV